MPTDEERVQAFMAKWSTSVLDEHSMRTDLHALLREVREEESGAELPTTTGVTAIIARAEPRIYELFARLAPAGTTPPEHVLAEAKRQVGVILKDTLVESGMSEAGASSLAAVLLAFTSVSKKR